MALSVAIVSYQYVFFPSISANNPKAFSVNSKKKTRLPTAFPHAKPRAPNRGHGMPGLFVRAVLEWFCCWHFYNIYIVRVSCC